jgi:diguanylate cyclase (GGDEF)-like protein
VKEGIALDSDPERSYTSIPMRAKDRLIGLLLLGGYQPRLLSNRMRNLAQVMGDLIAISIENSQLHESIRQQALRDSLTGLYNHGHMHERLHEVVAYAHRQKHSVVFMMLDLDNFKRFNDTYGHVAGDVALRQVANVLKNSVRAGDIVSRYGGEEFAIILLDAGIEQACLIAERICSRMRGNRIPGIELDTPLTMSIGIAIMSQESQSEHALVIAADAALYRAKSSGRDRYEIAYITEDTRPILETTAEKDVSI